MADSPDYLRANVEAWEARRDGQRKLARRQWSEEQPNWGTFAVPESVAGLLPSDLDGAWALELGCGTAYVSSWLARRGAYPIAVDPAAGQLTIAAEMQVELGWPFPLVRAAGEQVPSGTGRSTW